MGFIGVGLAVLALLAIRSVVTRVRAMGRLVSEAHWRAIAAALPKQRMAAFAELGVAPHPPDDARVVVTEEGVAFVLTSQKLPDRELLLTHLSISRRGKFVPWAAAGRFAFLVLHQLGIRPAQAAVSHGRAGIAHVLFTEPSSAMDAAPMPGDLPEDLTGLMQAAGFFVREIVESGALRREEGELVDAVLRAT